MRTLLIRLRRCLFGVDDIVQIGERHGTTGAWGRTGALYLTGSAVPHTARGHSSYSVRTRQGWWVWVNKGKIAYWAVKPGHATVLDADGQPWAGDPRTLRAPR